MVNGFVFFWFAQLGDKRANLVHNIRTLNRNTTCNNIHQSKPNKAITPNGYTNVLFAITLSQTMGIDINLSASSCFAEYYVSCHRVEVALV